MHLVYAEIHGNAEEQNADMQKSSQTGRKIMALIIMKVEGICLLLKITHLLDVADNTEINVKKAGCDTSTHIKIISLYGK